MAKEKRKRMRPASTEEGRENQLISLAMDEAERQMLEGTAPGMLITHYLKLGSSREQLEQERLREENQLLRAKVEQLASQKRIEDLYAEAMTAFRSYSGQEPITLDDVDVQD
jgi:hypothetical protein